MTNDVRDTDIAIIGMAGQFPNSPDLDQFWQNICGNGDLIARFSTEEALSETGLDKSEVLNSKYVAAKGCIDNVFSFDHQLFNCTPVEAEYMDPQQRKLLECTWHALENANLDVSRYEGDIASFYCSSLNTYLFYYIYPNIMASKGRLQDENLIILGNEKDFLATKIAFKFGLTGPSKTVQTACSSSLVCIADACQSLLNYESDVALAGSASITLPVKSGYFYTEQDINSPDGVCRPFDSQANGTVPGNGVAVLVLKRLQDAVNDQDNILSVIRGFSVNNDGNGKIGYTAPSQDGQRKCIIQAIENASATARDLSYIETHGTATKLGDPIEFAALKESFSEYTEDRNFCALGALKANIGHLDACSGIAGLIKTILVMRHRIIPGHCHYTEPNSELDITNSPFYINKETIAYPYSEKKFIAGVSSFGIGGTNAHVILEEYSAKDVNVTLPMENYIFVFSAATKYALVANLNLHAELLEKTTSQPCQIAYTLQSGRQHLQYRMCIIAKSISELKDKIDKQDYQIFNTKEKGCSVDEKCLGELEQLLATETIVSTEENLSLIKECWLNNHTIPWQKLYVSLPSRVQLPFYQFDKKEFSFSKVQKNNAVYTATTIDELLLEMIKNTLKLDNITLSDNFIELGGDSMLALEILDQLQTLLHVEIPIYTFHEAKTIEDIAQVVNAQILENIDSLSELQLLDIKKYFKE